MPFFVLVVSARPVARLEYFTIEQVRFFIYRRCLRDEFCIRSSWFAFTALAAVENTEEYTKYAEKGTYEA